MQRRHFTAGTLALCGGAAAWAQAGPQVQLAGTMGAKALLVIDGQTQMVAVGETRNGVRLVSLQGDTAQVDRGGGIVTLRVGASPVVVGTGAPRPGSGAGEIVLTAGPGGHFTTLGSINGKSVEFMVDTGATSVALSQSDAARIGLDLRNGQRGFTSTANGTVPVVGVTLTSVRVGEIEVINVAAVVVPAQMPHVLLGNSFHTRFQMRRDNDVMRLELRR
jgi:aspartyl protease family protein